MDQHSPNQMAVPTVSVVGQDGNELRINRSDFENPPEGVKWKPWKEPSSPTLKDGKSANKADGKPKKAAEDPDKVLTVIDRDGRKFIADGDGNVIDDDERFNFTEGYATDADAWAAAYPPA
jgi:hypothetical protein